MMRLIVWNITKSRKPPREAEVLVISVSKSGRTWLRLMLAKFFAEYYGCPMSLERPHEGDRRIPRIFFTHEAWEHRYKTSWMGWLRGRHLTPDPILRERKVILLYRDPRDVVVSFYHHMNKRESSGAADSIGRFIRHRRYGIDSMIEIMNQWRRRLAQHPGCFWLRYEDLCEETVNRLEATIQFLGIDAPPRALLESVADYASIDNMREMERANHFQWKFLRPVDPEDPNSYKTRRGGRGRLSRRACRRRHRLRGRGGRAS